MTKKIKDREINDKVYKVAGLHLSSKFNKEGQGQINKVIENFDSSEETFSSPAEASKFLEENSKSVIEPRKKKKKIIKKKKSILPQIFILIMMLLFLAWYFNILS